MPVLEILEAHLRVMGQRGTSVLCICGWHAEALGKRSEDLHRAHMAEVLEEHMREREASAKAHALEEAAAELDKSKQPSRHGLPMMLRADWLRGRAAQIRATP